MKELAPVCICVVGAKRLKDTPRKFWREGRRRRLFSRLESDREGCGRDEKVVHLRLHCALFSFLPADTVATQSSFSCHLEKSYLHYVRCSLILLFTVVSSSSLDICWCLISYTIWIWICLCKALDLTYPLQVLLLKYSMYMIFLSFAISSSRPPLTVHGRLIIFQHFSEAFQKVPPAASFTVTSEAFLMMQGHMNWGEDCGANRLTAVYLIKEVVEVLIPVGKLGCCSSIK